MTPWAANDLPLSGLEQLGPLGAVLAVLFWFFWQVYKHERDRADRAEKTLLDYVQQQTALAEKQHAALAEANRALDRAETRRRS